MSHATVPERPDTSDVLIMPDITRVCAHKGQYHLEDVWMTVYRLKLQKPDNDETAEDYFARHLNHVN